MGESEALDEFKEGLRLLRVGEALDALPHLRRSVTLDVRNPFYLSYLGLAIGMGERNWGKAEDLCFRALRMKRQQPELYLNMAEVYRRLGKKDDALWILKAGLEITRSDPRLRNALSRLGVRRPPVLNFLDRRHFLNRKLGKLRHRLWASRKRSA